MSRLGREVIADGSLGYHQAFQSRTMSSLAVAPFHVTEALRQATFLIETKGTPTGSASVLGVKRADLLAELREGATRVRTTMADEAAVGRSCIERLMGRRSLSRVVQVL